MYSDSIETLLLRHYGNPAPIPSGLEEGLRVYIHSSVAEQRRQHLMAARLRKYRVSRRKAMRLVAIGSASLGILSMGIEALQMLEASLSAQEATQSALP